MRTRSLTLGRCLLAYYRLLAFIRAFRFLPAFWLSYPPIRFFTCLPAFLRVKQLPYVTTSSLPVCRQLRNCLHEDKIVNSWPLPSSLLSTSSFHTRLPLPTRLLAFLPANQIFHLPSSFPTRQTASLRDHQFPTCLPSPPDRKST